MQQNKTKVKQREEKPERRQAILLNQFKMFVGREKELLKQANEDPYQFFTCNTKWPICRINYTKPHQVVEEFVFKVEFLSDVEIYQDYFAP